MAWTVSDKAPGERGRSPRVFFFQAEDGIRDHCVTGVQTCALPISLTVSAIATAIAATLGILAGAALAVARFPGRRGVLRSEERRVGKERSAGWQPQRDNKKNQRARHREPGRLSRRGQPRAARPNQR